MRLEPKSNVSRAIENLTVLTACWYVFLCGLHFFQLRPLWNDEEAVLSSLYFLSAHDLFSGPLNAVQVFPRVYLYIIQMLSRYFNFTVWSMRLLPFVCMLAAFSLWLNIGRGLFKRKVDFLVFVMSWGASGLLLYYAAELKQYSMDVLCGAIATFFILNHDVIRERQTRVIYYIMLAALPLMGFFSYTAFLFLVIIGYNLTWRVLRKRGTLGELLIFAFSIAVVLTCSYVFDMQHRNALEVNAGYAEYFIHFDSLRAFFKSFGEGLNNTFSRWFLESPVWAIHVGRIWTTFGFLYVVYAFFAHIKRENWEIRSLETMGFVLLCQLIVLAGFKFYPFGVPRTILFFCPIVLYAIIQGLNKLRDLHAFAHIVIYSGYIIFLTLLIIGHTRLIFIGELTNMPSFW